MTGCGIPACGFRLRLGAADRLPEQRPLIPVQPQLLPERGFIAIVKPGSQTERCGREIDVLRDQAGIHIIIGFADLLIIKSGFLEARRLEFLKVDDVDQADGGLRAGPPLPRTERQYAAIAGCNRRQPVEIGLG